MDVVLKPQVRPKNFHMIPDFLLYDASYGKKRVLFQMVLKSYMMPYLDVDEYPTIMYCKRCILQFLSVKTNRHKSGIDVQLQTFIETIESQGFIEKTNNSPYQTFTFYKLPHTSEKKNLLFFPENKYGIIYNFEFLHLLELSKNKQLPERVNIWTLLLVLSYFRVNIVFRTANKYNTKENIKQRPETYVTTIDKISSDLNVYPLAVANCIDFLDKAGIIYHEQLFKNLDIIERPVYSKIIFVNKYKYDGTQFYLLDSTYDYMREIAKTKRQLKPYGEFGKKLQNSSTEIDD